MSIENETPTTILVRLRTRLNDLLKLGITTPEGFGLYQQTILQLLGEFERRQQDCHNQAAQLRQQAAAAEAQAHGFIAAKSLLFAVVNGFVEVEEKRLRELAELEADKKASQVEPEPEPKSEPKKRGRPRKKTEGAEAAPPEATDAPDQG